MKYNKKEIIEGLKNNPSKTINDNLGIIKDKNKKIESRIFIINILGKVYWHDRISFYHLYEENKYCIKKIKITFLEILKDESENVKVKIKIVKSLRNNPLLFGPVDVNMIILLEKIISDKNENENLRKETQKTLDSIDSPYKKRKISYHPNVNYNKDSIILKDAIEKSIKKLKEAMEPTNKMAEDYQKYLQAASRSSKNYIEFIKKLKEAMEPTNKMAEDYQKYLQAISKSYQKSFEDIKKLKGILKIDEFIAAFEYAEKLKKIIKDYAKK